MVAAAPTRTSGGRRRPASVADWDSEMDVGGICGPRRVRGGRGERQSRPHPGAAFFSYQRGWPTGPRCLLSRGTVKQGQDRLPDGRRACSGFVEPAYFPRFKRKTVGKARGGHRREWKRMTGGAAAMSFPAVRHECVTQLRDDLLRLALLPSCRCHRKSPPPWGGADLHHDRIRISKAGQHEAT